MQHHPSQPTSSAAAQQRCAMQARFSAPGNTNPAVAASGQATNSIQAMTHCCLRVLIYSRQPSATETTFNKKSSERMSVELAGLLLLLCLNLLF
jgi:hypothetical protein